MTNILLQSGSVGMQMGLQQAGQAAADIAGAVHDHDVYNNASNDVSLASSAVDLLQAEHQVKASAQVVKVADELLGSFIDTVV